jgi:hypothetical protein
MNVDEAWKNERFARNRRVIHDLDEEIPFDREPAGPRAVDWVDQKSL